MNPVGVTGYDESVQPLCAGQPLCAIASKHNFFLQKTPFLLSFVKNSIFANVKPTIMVEIAGLEFPEGKTQ